MTDLQKNQAIYQAMCEIAQKYFNQAADNCEEFKEFMAKKYAITLSELEKCSEWRYGGKNTIIFEKEQITVDTFHCKFLGNNVFDLMRRFKSLAKAKGDYIFTYEEEIPNKFVGTVDITLENPTGAKRLVNCVDDDELRPSMNHVMLEVNATSGDISIVATEGHILSVISNNPATICTPHGENDRVFQALFTKDDWKCICDYARKAKSAITFRIYERGQMELFDTIVSVLGNTKVKSKQEDQRYPNYKAVLPNPSAMQSFRIHPDDVKAARIFVKNTAKSDKDGYVNVSFYKGSDLVYFDYIDLVCNITRTATFRLTRPSDKTIGTAYALRYLKNLKFTGFCIQSPSASSATLVEDESADLTLLMPVGKEDDDDYVYDAENREVIREHSLTTATIAA